LEANLDPALIDWGELERLVRSYGGDLIGEIGDAELRSNLATLPGIVAPEPPDRDEFRAVDIKQRNDIYERFVPRFFFGCEADDRTVAFAFSDVNAFSARLQPVLSSDISHWDVLDMAEVVADSFKLVQKEILTERQYEDFVCRNPFRLFTGSNPQFFDGTVLEGYARHQLQSESSG
jgi:hypothetical protein